jgi:adenylate cyclase
MAARHRTVLFAEVSGRDEFLRVAGPVMGWNGISDCIDRVQRTARSSGGRVVKVVGSELMMLFDNPDAAAGAASRMHAAVGELPSVAGTRLSIKIGYHAGPVTEGNNDLLGDTVQLVSGLLRQARAGQTMTTPQTAKLLSSPPRPDAAPARATLAPAGERERQAPQQSVTPRARRMRLSYGSQSVICSPDNVVIVVGRDPSCGLVAATTFASRRHCTITLLRDGFRISDHSSNGTFVTNEGGDEIELRNGEEARLAAHGWVSLGCTSVFASRLLEFTAE